MAYRLDYQPCANSELKYITRIEANSLPLSLCISLFQLLAIFHVSKTEVSNILMRKINTLVSETKSKFPQGSEYLTIFSEFCSNICQGISSHISLEYIDNYTICQSQPDESSFIFKIDIASRCMMCTMISNKLADSGQSLKENEFFGQQDMRDLDHMIFKKFVEYFMVSIKIYGNRSHEIVDNPNQGSFPLVHLYKENYKYALAYPLDLIEIRTNPEFNIKTIENLPFMLNKKSSCPIAFPVQQNKPQVKEIDYNDDLKVMRNLVEIMSKHIMSKNTYEKEIIDSVTISIEKNEYSRNIPILAEFVKSASLSLNQKKCPTCKESYSESTSTSHNNCEVCDNCMTNPKYNGRCPKCNSPYTLDDRNKLRLP